MANRNYEFFGRRNEVIDLLLPVIEQLDLVVMTDGGGLDPMQVVMPESLRRLDPAEPAHFQLARAFLSGDTLTETHMTPAKWGWVSLQLPQERGVDLLMGSLAAKNEWHEDGVRKTAQTSFDLFAQVSSALKKHARGVRVRNTATGATRGVTNVGVPQGAREWVASRGKLRHDLARNIEYELAESA